MGGSHVDVIEKRTKVPDLSDIDETLRPLIEAMLQPNPDDRPGDAAMVCELLKASAPADQQAATARGGNGGPTGATGIPFQTQPDSGARTRHADGHAICLDGPDAGGRPQGGRRQPSCRRSRRCPPASRLSAPRRLTPRPAPPVRPALLSPPAQPRRYPQGRNPEPAVWSWQAVLLVLLIGGAGGAYMSGLIGPGKDEYPAAGRRVARRRCGEGRDTGGNDRASCNESVARRHQADREEPAARGDRSGARGHGQIRGGGAGAAACRRAARRGRRDRARRTCGDGRRPRKRRTCRRRRPPTSRPPKRRRRRCPISPSKPTRKRKLRRPGSPRWWTSACRGCAAMTAANASSWR